MRYHGAITVHMTKCSCTAPNGALYMYTSIVAASHLCAIQNYTKLLNCPRYLARRRHPRRRRYRRLQIRQICLFSNFLKAESASFADPSPTFASGCEQASTLAPSKENITLHSLGSPLTKNEGYRSTSSATTSVIWVEIVSCGNRHVEIGDYLGNKCVFRFLQGIALGACGRSFCQRKKWAQRRRSVAIVISYLLFTEVLIFNMCYIAYVVIDFNIHGNRYVEIYLFRR